MHDVLRLPKGLFILEQESFEWIYGPAEQREIRALVDVYALPQTSASIQRNLSLLQEAEVIFTGWGAPIMDEAFLAAAPSLRAVFYGAGSIRGFTTEAFWKRGIQVTSASFFNAMPVAEYVLGTILLSLKHFWRYSTQTRGGAGWLGDAPRAVPGCYGSTVGMVSFGRVARRTLELLQPFDVRCVVTCPFLTEAEAAGLNVERRTLDEVFEESDVVSLHTPDLPETRGMITGRHFASMKYGATFINTARGALVREEEMIEVLQKRPDLTAVLDVTSPEPPARDSLLLSLPNVVLTPHIAGSMGKECTRMGRFMVEELHRYLAGMPLEGEITWELAASLA